MAAAAGEKAAAPAPWAKRAAPSRCGSPPITNAADAAAKTTRPPAITGLVPVRSARAPKTGFKTTSAPS